MKTLCIYHGNCADGFGAAWAVRQALGGENVDFHAAAYGKPAPAVEGRSVIIVDFSYPLETLQQMAETATSILVIDHHKTAAEALAQLPKAPSSFLLWLESADQLAALFDMHRSGAGMTWDFFFPDQPRPALINHIEDRDLWQFKLEGTKDVMAAVFSHPQDFATWDLLMADHINALRLDGHAIERKQQKDVAGLVASNSRYMVIGGVTVPVVNLPHTMASDAGELLSQGQPFAAIYWDTADGRQFSLRSTDAGEDVSAIAQQYGGGGHRNAAGFKVPFEHPLACNAPALKCFQVGENDIVAAYTPEQAVAILGAFAGYHYTTDDASEWTAAQLDAPVFEEDGVTPADPWRTTFAACVYPQYITGWE
ncbi:MAG: phosphohydrolase [Pseudomonas sp.]|uniref:DHH family phosphoesterase n=1 Tax=Pseudomonas sp. TaxID=306 RepID=UPI003BB5FEFA